MKLQPLTQFEVNQPLMSWTPRPVMRRMAAFQAAIGANVDLRASRRQPLFTNTLVMPSAKLVLAGTSCSRPMYFPECELLADVSEFDVALLRHDVDRGVSFDIRFKDTGQWSCCYLAWWHPYDGLWLIPTAGEETFIQAGELGLTRTTYAPFADARRRAEGIVRAIETPSFTGGR